jgi:murein DD-endopeptidase MepM/ murein hydrolase activator NlpD
MKEKRLLLGLLIVLLMAVTALLVVAIVEVHSFRRYVRELIVLKEDYENYRQGLRRVIAEQQGEHAHDVVTVKKKVLMRVEQAFNPVNRDTAYLHDAALKYAQSKGLEMQWYTKLPSEAYIRRPSKRGVRRRQVGRIVRKTVRPAVADYDVLGVIREHSFILPIDVRLFRISSRFGPRRKRDGTWGFHYGLDLAAPYKTPVRAMAYGVVIEARQATGFGNTVVISHSNKLKTRYAHLARYHVKVGDSVAQGQLIGLVGNTGNVRGKNGIHLHIELLLYGKQVDPWYIFNELRRV